jgi:hypothetical protein
VTHSIYASDMTVPHAVCLGQDIAAHLTLITVCHMIWAGMDSSFVYKYNMWKQHSSPASGDGNRDSLWNVGHHLCSDTVDDQNDFIL